MYNKNMLDRQKILAQLSSPAATVDLPELGGDIGVRRVAFQEAMTLAEAGTGVDDSIEEQERFLVEMVLLCACDDQGNRLFTNEDRSAVAKLPAVALQRVADVALEVNGLAGDSVEEAVKNSATTHADAGS